jgi:CIC family chloride channel protein
LELKGIHLQAETIADGLWDGLRAVDVMQQKVETLSSAVIIHEAMQSFARSRHRGFPVMNDDRLVGIITQVDLVKAQESKISLDAPISEIMTQKPITVSPEERLTQVLYLLSYYKLARLPVIDRDKLVGIITRSDILRAQAKRLRGVTSQISKSSYLVYQQRGIATGKGRLLLPLSNSQTATYLIEMALAIAEKQNYELECLHVISILSHLSPSTTAVNLNVSLALFQQVTNIAETRQVPIHTQVRVAHDVGKAILEVASDRQIDLLLIGWSGKSQSSDRLFGNTVDRLMKQANCDVMLVKFSDRIQKVNPFYQEFKKPNISFARWLIPITEGTSNTEKILLLLPSLISLSPYPKVCLCQIFSPDNDKHNPNTYQDTQLEEYAETLNKLLYFPVGKTSICSKSIADAILDLANQERSDVIMLGASHEGILQQIMHGNIPEAIARNSNRTIIVFRKAN